MAYAIIQADRFFAEETQVLSSWADRARAIFHAQNYNRASRRGGDKVQLIECDKPTGSMIAASDIGTTYPRVSLRGLRSESPYNKKRGRP